MLVPDHVSISVPDLQRARPFHDAVMAALGVAKVYDRPDVLGYGVGRNPGVLSCSTTRTRRAAGLRCRPHGGRGRADAGCAG
ncbi:MAG: hypothetical protein ACREP0_12870 [Rhodanobacteraceae bacterium]